MRMPRWFRFAVFALAAALLVPFVLLKSSSGREALAYATRSVAGAMPILDAHAALSGQVALPGDGSYRINGMPVEYHTYAVREDASSITRKFQAGFEKAGYKHGVVAVQGSPMLVALHPETQMMLTVRLVRDRQGTPGMRLTQQDLSKLDPAYDARIPGMPLYPGSTERMLVSSIEGTPSQSLTFQAPGSAPMVEQFYRTEMQAEGWQRFEPPVRLPDGSPVSLFFERDGLESSLLIVPQEGTTASFVMLTLTGDPEGLS